MSSSPAAEAPVVEETVVEEVVVATDAQGDAPEAAGNNEDMFGSPSPAPDGDREDSYVPATETTEARIPSFKKRGVSGEASGDAGEEEEGDDDEEAAERRRNRKKKKREQRRAEAAAEAEDEEDRPVDEATARRLAIEERIEAIGKKQRTTRRKKKDGEGVDIVDSYHDEFCIGLHNRMIAAADRDQNANINKMPATSKLAMLDEVYRSLQNTTLWSSIIDNEVLKAVKRWLEPLPDKSLPAVGIQNAIFEVLPKMDLDTATIREAGLGPIVLFYTKTKRVSPAISRQADALVQAWSRPIIKRPADYRSKHIASADQLEIQGGEEIEDETLYEDETQAPRARPAKAGKPRRFDVRKALEENEGRKGARPLIANYTVAPESRTQHQQEDIAHVTRIQMDNRKFNRFARQLKTGGARR